MWTGKRQEGCEMKKIKVRDIKPDAQLAQRKGWQDVTVRWMVSAEETGSRHGCVAWIEVPPGVSYDIHRYGECERVVFVFTGSGEHLDSTRKLPLETGDAIYLAKGQWHGFRNSGPVPAQLLMLLAPIASPTQAGYEPYRALAAADGSGDPVVRVSGAVTPEDPDLRDDQGFIGLHVKWLINSETAPVEQMLFGLSRFDPTGSHVLHRHEHAEEVIYVIEGLGGLQLNEGYETPIEPGDLTFCAANEWHGHLAGSTEMKFIFLYLGAPSLAAAGYDVYEPDTIAH